MGLSMNKKLTSPAVAVLLLLASETSSATTKGLSQIVTPDVQPTGDLSLSVQAQSKDIGNPYQLQAELGLTDWWEIAASQGLSPNELIFGTEISLLDHGPYLLSTGFINWSTRGQKPQPFLEGGYYTEHDKFMGGPIRANDETELLLGWAHDFNSTWRFQVDYQSGTENFTTVGFTCNVTPSFQYNPAIYFSNDGAHRVSEYIVFTYTFSILRDRK
jgi:hypothetical protein